MIRIGIYHDGIPVAGYNGHVLPPVGHIIDIDGQVWAVIRTSSKLVNSRRSDGHIETDVSVHVEPLTASA